MLPSQRELYHSVQSFPPSTTMGGMLVGQMVRGPYLPYRGSKERDRVLRLYDNDENNTLWQGTRSGFSKKVASVEYTIDGEDDKLTQYYHDVLGNAHFGRGWQHFIKLCVRDYLSQSYGCVIEIVGYGEADEPLPADVPIIGINHLDSGRCYFTGNPIYPVIYYSLWDGRLHKMHADRVYILVDDPDPDERYLGIGTCALERAIAVAQREIRMAQYIESKLDDKPNPGVNVFSNLGEPQYEKAIAKYLQDMSNDARPVFGRTLNLFSVDPREPAKLESVPFSTPPDKFDFTQYVSLDVDMLALAFGTDRQEIWQLQGGNIGSAGQSEVLAEKSRGKTFGDFLTSLQRFLNWAILPVSCEAKLQDNDERKQKAQAEIDNMLADVATKLGQLPGVSTQMILQMLVDKSDTFKDAFTDENGKIILPIVDRYTPQQAINVDTVQPVAADQSAVAEAPQGQQQLTQAAQPSSLDGNTPVESDELQRTKDFDPSEPRDEYGRWTSGESLGVEHWVSSSGHSPKAGKNIWTSERGDFVRSSRQPSSYHYPHIPSSRIRSSGYEYYSGTSEWEKLANRRMSRLVRKEFDSTKSFNTTSATFKMRFTDIVSQALDKLLTPAEFETLMLANLESAGRNAFLDGLKQGGVDKLSELDESEFMRWTIDQIDFIDTLKQDVYSQSITQSQVPLRADMWSNKSLTDVYNMGLSSADRDGMYMWVYGDTEHCDDCARLNGQTHRYSEWYSRNWLPQSDKLACHGFLCKCRLIKTTQSASGRF